MGQHHGGRNEEHDLIARYANRLARFQCLFKITCPKCRTKGEDERNQREMCFTLAITNVPYLQLSWLGDKSRG